MNSPLYSQLARPIKTRWMNNSDDTRLLRGALALQRAHVHKTCDKIPLNIIPKQDDGDRISLIQDALQGIPHTIWTTSTFQLGRILFFTDREYVEETVEGTAGGPPGAD